MLHERGECNPCAYFHYKEDGCRQGEDCIFCHFCVPGALKLRKKQKMLRIATEKLAARKETRNRLGQKTSDQIFPRGFKADMRVKHVSPRDLAVKQNKSDDETTDVPSESESNGTGPWAAPISPKTPKSVGAMPLAPPPGLGLPSLTATIAMHSLPVSPDAGNRIMYEPINNIMQPAYMQSPTMSLFHLGDVNVSIMHL